MFISVKIMYSIGVYKDSDVADFVGWGRINEDQYKKITGKDYITKDSTGAA